MVGRPLTNRYPVHESHIGKEMFRIEDWRMRHPLDEARLVSKDVSINVRAGEIVGLAGLIGAGRTETAMSVFGRQYGTNASGRIFVEGKEVKFPTVRSAIDHGVAYATEDRKVYGLNLMKTIRENTSLASLKELSNRLGVVDETREKRTAEKYRKEFRTKAPTIEMPAGNLSGGNQQKVVLAKWMATDPKVLILDEPTRGIDVGGNRKAAILSGIDTRKVDFEIFLNMGFLVSIASIITLSRLASASAQTGMEFEMDAIAACFIGGTAVTGGIGTIPGAMVGALIMGVLNQGLSIMGVDAAWVKTIKGLVVIAAVAYDLLSKKKKG